MGGHFDGPGGEFVVEVWKCWMIESIKVEICYGYSIGVPEVSLSVPKWEVEVKVVVVEGGMMDGGGLSAGKYMSHV